MSNSSSRFNKVYLNVLERLLSEKKFLLFISISFIAAALVSGNWRLSMWFGFIYTAYAAVANDSIQTLGTFIESNGHRKWWLLWLYTGGILLVTLTFSYIYYDGDVTYQRLLKNGVTKYPHPTEFSYFQLIAPIVLIMLTRMRMPVSTTFLLLSVFSADTSGITKVIGKSLTGYVLAFAVSFLVWLLAYRAISKYFSSRSVHPAWTVVKWIVSGALWSVWIMQDGANIAVYLPRKLELYQFIIFSGTIFLGMALLFYLRGDKIQGVVSEKTRVGDMRAATLIDFTYVLLLIYKLFISTVPLSTTWVFLGIIGGREIAIGLARKKVGALHKVKALKIIGKDFLYAMIGLFISLALALGANPSIREEIAKSLGF
jgi:hypothetical protein